MRHRLFDFWAPFLEFKLFFGERCCWNIRWCIGPCNENGKFYERPRTSTSSEGLHWACFRCEELFSLRVSLKNFKVKKWFLIISRLYHMVDRTRFSDSLLKSEWHVIFLVSFRWLFELFHIWHVLIQKYWKKPQL